MEYDASLPLKDNNLSVPELISEVIEERGLIYGYNYNEDSLGDIERYLEDISVHLSNISDGIDDSNVHLKNSKEILSSSNKLGEKEEGNILEQIVKLKDSSEAIIWILKLSLLIPGVSKFTKPLVFYLCGKFPFLSEIL